MQLESGIVVAVLIAAVLVYDRLGGSDELARRMYQVALGVSLVFLVIAATNAFIRPSPEGGFEILGSDFGGGNTSDNADRIAAATTIHYMLGVLFFVTGLTTNRRMHTVPLGFALGGLLLIFIGGSLTGVEAYDRLIRLGLGSSQGVDAVTFVAALGGTSALIWYGFRLESEYETIEVEEPDDKEPPPLT
ncbi:MAG TPA: hypothetical protein VJP07_11235 [Dehalococcoidia bacterium]|nr:hypothetical protein [Dehalococcoidia bacterium]